MHFMVKNSAIAATAILALTAIGLNAEKSEDSKKAENIEKVGEPVNCIHPSRISSTTVLDNKTIEFRMVGRKFFRNVMERGCPGLRKHDAISYTVRGSQLCHVDTFTVLQTSTGRVQGRARCAFGKFQQIEKIKPQK